MSSITEVNQRIDYFFLIEILWDFSGSGIFFKYFLMNVMIQRLINPLANKDQFLPQNANNWGKMLIAAALLVGAASLSIPPSAAQLSSR